MSITLYDPTSSAPAGAIRATINTVLSCPIVFDNRYIDSGILSQLVLSGVPISAANIGAQIYTYRIALSSNSNSYRPLTSINITPNNKISIDSNTGVLTISATTPCVSGFMVFGFARSLSTYDTVLVGASVPITFTSAGTSLVSNLTGTPIDKVSVYNNSLPLSSAKTFTSVFVSLSYNSLDTILARYINYNYYQDSWSLGDNTKAIESLILTKDYYDTDYTWKLLKGNTVLYTLSSGTQIENMFDLRRILCSVNNIWVPASGSYSPISVSKAPALSTTAYSSNLKNLTKIEDILIRRNNDNNYEKFFGKAFVKETYTDTDTILADYTSSGYNWTLVNGISSGIDRIILAKDCDDDTFKWKVVNGSLSSYTVLYTLSADNVVEPRNYLSGSSIGSNLLDVSGLLTGQDRWIPESPSHLPIWSTVAMPMGSDTTYLVSVPSYKELPVISTDSTIFIENTPLSYFQIAADMMGDMWSQPISSNFFGVEEFYTKSEISPYAFIDSSSGLFFAKTLRAGRTTLKVSATNKNGTTSKVINVVVGSYEPGDTNFTRVSSSYYPVSSLFASPEIDHVVTASIPYAPDGEFIFRLGNRKPTSQNTNFYFTTYFTLLDNGALTPFNPYLIEAPKDPASNNPFIRRFDTPIEFGSARQKMYWGIAAKEMPGVDRDKAVWGDENIPYLFVNPVSSYTIPLTGWLKSDISTLTYAYTAFDGKAEPTYDINCEDVGDYEIHDSCLIPTLSAFYSSNIHTAISGTLSSAGSLIPATELSFTSNYYARNGTSLVKVNTDIPLIYNYDPFKYINNDIIRQIESETAYITTSFWKNFYAVTYRKEFTLPTPPALSVKYINETIPYEYKSYELSSFYANFLNKLGETNLSLNYAVLLDNKAWLSVEPPINDAPTFLINAGYPIALSSQQISAFTGYNTLPDGENRLKRLYWADNSTNTYPRIVGNKNGIGYFGSLSAKCYWGIQLDRTTFTAVNPNIGNNEAFQFPLSGWLTTSNRSSFRITSSYRQLSSAPSLAINNELSPKLYYANIRNLATYEPLSGFINHGKADIFRGRITAGDFSDPEEYLRRAERYNSDYIAYSPSVAYGNDVRFGEERVASLRLLGYI